MPQISVGTAATLLTTATPADSTQGQSVHVKLKSTATASVFLGRTATVTATGGSIGYELQAGETLDWDMQPGEALYGIVTTGTQTVHVLEGGI